MPKRSDGAVSTMKEETVALKLKSGFSKYGILLALFILVAAISFASPAFLSFTNIFNVLRQVSMIGYMAIGVTFVLLTGGIDLSVGSILGLSGIIVASFAKTFPDSPVVLMVGVGIAIGCLVGLANGIFISYMGVVPFVATLGMLSVGRGITLVYCNGSPIPGLSENFLSLAAGDVFGVPVPVIILLAVFIIASIFLYRIRFGRYVYAIGGNEASAIVSGVKVKKIKMLVYLLSGALCGLAGVVFTSRVTSGLPLAGEGYELDVIAACVIGGVSLSGGKGKLWGTLVGVILVGVINNALDLLNVSSYVQLIVKGLIIIMAVFMDSQLNKSK